MTTSPASQGPGCAPAATRSRACDLAIIAGVVTLAFLLHIVAFLALAVPQQNNIALPADLPYPPVDRAIAQYV